MVNVTFTNISLINYTDHVIGNLQALYRNPLLVNSSGTWFDVNYADIAINTPQAEKESTFIFKR